MIELFIASAISSFISSSAMLIAMRMRLRHLDKRDEREANRYEFAAMQASDAFYRGGDKALRSMADVQVSLLKATAPEPRRGLLEQLRRQPAEPPPQQQALPPGHPEPLSPENRTSVSDP